MEPGIKAYAKVNLHLEVLNRRDDGYHDILSVMTSIGLHDLLKLDSADFYPGNGPTDVVYKNISGKYSDVFNDIPHHENLITRAIILYAKIANIQGKAVISIDKDIPSGAGLGGGSADAAAALILMNKMNNSRVPFEKLLEYGKTLGADVPFCLTGKTAICEGIGDIIEPVEARLKGFAAILNDGIHSNTGDAYRALNRTDVSSINKNDIRREKTLIKKILSRGSIAEFSGVFKNDFEGPVFSSHPRIRQIKEAAISEGAGFAMMTGSGSSVIALFDDEQKARRAETNLASDIQNVIITEFV